MADVVHQCALAAMLATGYEDFADILAPLQHSEVPTSRPANQDASVDLDWQRYIDHGFSAKAATHKLWTFSASY
jgi:hypothetical protein